LSKTLKIIIVILSFVVLLIAFGAGYNLGQRVPSGPVEGTDVIEEAWGIIFNDYVDKSKLDVDELSGGAVRGMMEALDDPYSSYMDAESYELGMTQLEGEFDGIGAHLTVKDEQLTIIAPISGSPADIAGIRAGDIILEVDGKLISEMSLGEAILNIRGAKGTPVNLMVLHEGEEDPVKITVIRDTIELASVEFEMREEFAHITITHFSSRTDEEIVPALENAVSQGASGIILDLRNNPGGLLDTVVEVVSHFVDEGVAVSVVDSEGRSASLNVNKKELITDLPIVVLVNEYSASGSEVLSGALQDYKRATIAGVQTYGKGSVNILRQLQDGSGIYITTARWLTPNGHLIEGEGITPDFALELEGDEALQWAVDYLRATD